MTEALQAEPNLNWVGTSLNFLALPLAILVFLLPGFAWLLLSGVLKRLNMLGAVAFSFMLSICLLSVTSVLLSLLTSEYLIYTIVLAAIIPTIVMAVYLKRQGFGKILANGVSVSPILLLCLAVYILFLAAFFWSTPYYPAVIPHDPLVHAQITQSISGGNGRSVLLHTNYAVGVHFVAAIIMELLGMNALQALTALASLVLLTSLILIFTSAQTLLGTDKLAALATIVGALVLPVDAMHLVLIGTYANLVEDAIVIMAIFLLFSYVVEPSLPVGVTLILIGLAGALTHSSFLVFLAVIWLLLPLVLVLFHEKGQVRRYFRACLYPAAGILFAALIALSFLEGSVGRLARAHSILRLIGGATTAQLIQSLASVYAAFAWNLVFLIKPVNLVAVALGLILVSVKGGRSIRRMFAACWFTLLVIMSLLSGQTDRFVLLSMVPAIFLIGDLVGNMPLPKWTRLGAVNRRIVVAGVLLILVTFGGFLPLIPIAYSPSTRLHQQHIFASMEWLEENPCPSGVAAIGLGFDFRYLPILTTVQYSGSLPSTENSSQVLQESTVMGFSCVVVQTDTPSFHSLELNQAFQERYKNTEVAIFFITTQGT